MSHGKDINFKLTRAWTLLLVTFHTSWDHHSSTNPASNWRDTQTTSHAEAKLAPNRSLWTERKSCLHIFNSAYSIQGVIVVLIFKQFSLAFRLSIICSTSQESRELQLGSRRWWEAEGSCRDPQRRLSVLSGQGCVCRRSAGSLTMCTPMKMPSDARPV